MIDYSDFLHNLENTALASWREVLPQQLEDGLNPQRFGDIKQWFGALAELPDIAPSHYDIVSEVRVGLGADVDYESSQKLKSALSVLQPWRKGPFTIFDLHIDTEWRSDWKWDRLVPHISPLENKRVLDVGCGNGYHCWRMRGAGAAQVIGIDPSPRFVIQFYMLKKYLAAAAPQPVDVLPIGIQDLPPNLRAFDSVFSMGVLYHRRSPLDHLLQLRDTLIQGGELVLETLIIDGDKGFSLVPKDRYAKMRNVWFIPTAATLTGWLEKCGFEHARCVDINHTTTDEQRATDWMTSQSLADFLDPENPNLTIEGYPAPRRGIFIANRA